MSVGRPSTRHDRFVAAIRALPSRKITFSAGWFKCGSRPCFCGDSICGPLWIRQWIGGIDEVVLHARALSDSEIRGHAEALKP